MWALPGHEVEVPGEIIRPSVGSETAVLAVMGFQAGEVSFQPIGSGRYVRVVEVVEHIWQRPQKHAAGTLYVAENPPGFFAGCYFGAVHGFPGGDEVEKCFPVRRSGNPGDLEEDLP